MAATTPDATQLRGIVERVLTEWKDFGYKDDGVLMFDREHDRYALLWVDWHGQRRVHSVIVHIDIINDKCWVQADNTPQGVALDLEAAGVPKSQIVLAFYPLEHRRHGEYAAQ